MNLKILAALLLITSCKDKARHHIDTQPSAQESTIDTTHTLGVYDKVYFDENSAKLSDSAKEILKAQAVWLSNLDQNDMDYRLEIEGHADERGTAECNLLLSIERASAVKQYLVFLGLNIEKITTMAYGKTRPEITNSFQEAWRINRRALTTVEILSSQPEKIINSQNILDSK